MLTKTEELDERCGIYEITPEVAFSLLEETGKKRPLRQMVKEKYLRRMKENLWRMNGQPIILSPKGELLDGQHRLEAVVLLGKPMTFVVLYGSFDIRTMDENKPRDASDILAFDTDFKHGLILQAATRLILRHEYALEKEMSMMSVVKGRGTRDIENAELAHWVKKNVELVDIAAKACSLRSSHEQLVPVSPTVAAWFLVTKKADRAIADAFFEPLLTGAGLGLYDSRLALRRKLSNEKKVGERCQGYMVFAQICKAWNIRDQSVRVFSFKVGEAFPFIR